MTMTPEQDLRFTEFLRAKVLEADRRHRTNPKKFLGMLNSSGGFLTACQLLKNPYAVPTGFERLLEVRALEFSLEALILETEWRYHFDERLLIIAARRLRGAYELKAPPPDPRTAATAPEVPDKASTSGNTPGSNGALSVTPVSSSPSSGSPSAQCRDITLTVHWPYTLEHIPLQMGKLKVGDHLETVEMSSDHTAPYAYDVQCTRAEHADGGWHVDLLYDQTVNCVLAKSHPDLQWGTTRLWIPDDFRRPTAVFVSTSETTTEGSCSLVETSLFDALTRGQLNVLLRPGQGRLRRDLLRLGARCAVTNECMEEALEAAHLIRHSDNGSSETCNALLLRADIHTLFDTGKLEITADGAIRLVDMPPESRYLIDRPSWNVKLEPATLERVRAALVVRSNERAIRS